MKKIFIDSNIYLNFFDSNKPELRKLLDALIEIKDSLFLSSQIVDEVNRNKLGIAQRSLNNHFSKLANIQPISLPEHLEAVSTNLQNWNNQSKEMSQQRKNLQKMLEELIDSTLEEIMLSTDKVSQTFSILFEEAAKASESEIQAARYRREVGNPPGKSNDPLGDQISWEQFKNCSSGSENLWIITNDSDYYTVFKNKIYLNAFLYNELLVTNTAKPSIFCFKTLAEGLKHFNEQSSEKISTLPTKEELEIIAEEELFSSVTQIKAPNSFSIIERGKIINVTLPPGFSSPNHYIQYLKAYDSEELWQRDY